MTAKTWWWVLRDSYNAMPDVAAATRAAISNSATALDATISAICMSKRLEKKIKRFLMSKTSKKPKKEDMEEE